MEGIKNWKYDKNKSSEAAECIKILEAIEETKCELEVARSLFDNVEDSKLIEMAIFAEEMAKKRYEYLLLLAKKKGIKVSSEYILDHYAKIAE